jgi:hypothetical protein
MAESGTLRVTKSMVADKRLRAQSVKPPLKIA